VFGDVDGVVVIPGAIADDAIALAVAKVAAENRTRDALLRGELLQDVYARFGVL
jgi:regulator of RNase E activity RraA